MKNILKRICYTLAILISLNFMMDGSVATMVQAAPMTAQQKAKEKAKAQKAKEKAKAQKAKEQAAAQKAKEKQRAADQREREKVAQERVKQSEAAETKKQQADEAKKQQRIAQEAAYEKRVAETTKYNKKVAAYNARDIDHRLGFWGQVGYSSILTNGFGYSTTATTAAEQGFNAAAKGWIGGGAGLGYQLRYKTFLFQTGAEFQMYNSKTSLYGDNKALPSVVRSYEINASQGYGGQIYNYRMQNMVDMYKSGFVQIPLLFGMEFAEHQAYFLVGPKVGLNLLHSSALTGTLKTTITDVEAIEDFQNMSTHALGDQAISTAAMKDGWKFGLNAAVSGEIGLCLDRWMQPVPEKGKKLTPAQQNLKKMHTRLALFAEYGVLNIQAKGNAQDGKDLMSFAQPQNMSDIQYSSSLTTEAAASAKLNPLLVGAKMTFMFDLKREVKKPIPMPKAPLPRMAIQVVNAETGAGVEGATLGVHWLKGKFYSKTTNGKGYSRSTYPKGDYTITASKLGYYPCDTTYYTLERDLKDTIIIALRPEPVPIVYTFCGYVRSADKNQPLEADIRISSATDTTTIFAGAASDNGLFVSNLLEGDYIVHARHAGFMPLDDTIHFTQDTLNFRMMRIKEGIKVRIENLFFATGKTKILPESEPSLNDLYKFLSENATVMIMITGHTDNVGSARNNQILSEGRANSVRRELIKMGIAPDRIDAEGKGASEPVADNDTEEGRQTNRRVEFTILSTGGADIQLAK